MRFTKAMIAWNPGTEDIVVGPCPDADGWSDRYMSTSGACFTPLHSMSPENQRALLFINFNKIVVRDCVPVHAAHRAFLAIDEYRQFISPDQFGAEDKNGPLNTPWKKVVKERLQHSPQLRSAPRE